MPFDDNPGVLNVLWQRNISKQIELLQRFPDKLKYVAWKCDRKVASFAAVCSYWHGL